MNKIDEVTEFQAMHQILYCINRPDTIRGLRITRYVKHHRLTCPQISQQLIIKKRQSIK